ncbi:MAG: PCMD domain-containing protein [Bacteroidales bacterium]|nr:PCMD domain-containing protein [Bacteroidales bacterium]
MLKLKYIFLIIFLFYTLFSFSQNLPNYDFEEWEESKSFNNPIDWGTSNYSVWGIYNFNTVIQEELDTYSGNSSIKLETIEKNIAGEYVKIAGVITLGIFDVNLSTRKAEIKGGIPFTNRPSILSGYYKYSTSGLDSCIMSIFLTKHNTSTKNRDTLGIGVFTSNKQDEWSIFEAPVKYSSTETPDSMNIIILSSDTSIFDTGSTLFLDKLFIDASLSVPEKLLIPEIYVFPNPATDYFKINCPNISFCKYSIIDVTGKILISSKYHATEELINISNLNPGLYFIQVTIQNNIPVTKSIIIK